MENYKYKKQNILTEISCSDNEFVSVDTISWSKLFTKDELIRDDQHRLEKNIFWFNISYFSIYIKCRNKEKLITWFNISFSYLSSPSPLASSSFPSWATISLRDSHSMTAISLRFTNFFATEDVNKYCNRGHWLANTFFRKEKDIVEVECTPIVLTWRHSKTFNSWRFSQIVFNQDEFSDWMDMIADTRNNVNILNCKSIPSSQT